MRRDTRGVLSDIRTAVEHIVDDTAGAAIEMYLGDRRMRQLVERDFIVIGEAINRLTRHDPEIASRISAGAQIVAFRNILVHGYDIIDDATVWHLIQGSLPLLRAEVDALLAEGEGESTP